MLRLRHFLFAFLLVYASTCEAVEVAGFVRDGITGLPLRGAIVTLEGAGTASKQQVTRIDGFYSFDVRAGQRVVIRFAADGRNGRYVVFDAMAVPREWNDALVNELHIRLFPPMEGVDSALLSAPAAMFSWNAEEEAVLWDERAESRAQRWNAIMEAHLAQHPETRPSALERWVAAVFDRVAEEHFRIDKWMLAAVFGLLWLVYALIQRLLRRLAPTTQRVTLAVLLLGCVMLALDLSRVAGPLRFAAFFGLLGAVVAGAALAEDLLLGGSSARNGGSDDDEEEVVEGPDPEDKEGWTEIDAPVREPRWWRKVPWSTFMFLTAVVALFIEDRWGLENTMKVWGLVGKGATIGLVAAAWLAWSRSPAEFRARPRFILLSGGIWWFALPLLCVAAASFVNRSFLSGPERCQVWPVVEVWQGSKGIQVHVAIDGERERLEMDRAIKEQLTSLDSLRCCVHRGAFGFDFVERVEPVITASVPR